MIFFTEKGTSSHEESTCPEGEGVRSFGGFSLILKTSLSDMASPPPPAVDISPYQPSAAWQADAKDAALSERERRDREFSKGAANGSDPLVPFANNRDSVAPPASETGKSNDGRGEKQVKVC